LFLLSFLLAALASFNFSHAAEPKRVALLPFKINAEKDLSFLRDGIYDMLSTRLAREGQVEVLARSRVEEALQSLGESAAINEAGARGIGSRLGADFVLFGSLTVFGDSVSIDAKMVDVAGARPTMSFFDQAQDLGAVITKVNLIAADINHKIFGQAPVAAATPAAPPPKSEPTAGIYAHPEKILKEEGFVRQQDGRAEDSPIIMSGEARESGQTFWKSGNFKHLINGVALGDVDGDGKIETVTVTPEAVIIYRAEAGRFFTVAEVAAGNFKYPIGVDVADINANGKAEIFVTSFNPQKNILVSFVLEYDGANFVRIVDDSPWYYRVADTPARGKILLGQQPRFGKPFAGSIYEMTWQNQNYAPADPVKVKGPTNLVGFTIGDVLNNGQETAVAYTDSDRIRAMDESGAEIWKDADRFGGSMLYYLGPKDEQGQTANKIYLPLRLVVWKNRDKNESQVIAVKNYDITGYKLEWRQFNKTHIEAFSWDGLGLRPEWKTRTMSGYIQDFAVGDFDNDGRDELVAALILKEGSVALTEPKSTLIGYELRQTEKPES